MTEMTPKFLKKLCKEHSLYTTPSINDKLYLHYKGFTQIQNLDEYTGLKALWLEGNGISKIEGLDSLHLLRSLFLQENIIEKIEGLDSLIELDSINLSKNFIKKVENLDHLKKLTSINLAHNHLASVDDVRELSKVPSLETIDIQHNRINGGIDIIDEVLSQMPNLKVLYLMGNPFVKNIRHYRKMVIYKCKDLR